MSPIHHMKQLLIDLYAFFNLYSSVFPICDRNNVKTSKNMILTSKEHAKHPFTGQNTQLTDIIAQLV